MNFKLYFTEQGTRLAGDSLLQIVLCTVQGFFELHLLTFAWAMSCASCRIARNVESEKEATSGVSNRLLIDWYMVDNDACMSLTWTYGMIQDGFGSVSTSFLSKMTSEVESSLCEGRLESGESGPLSQIRAYFDTVSYLKTQMSTIFYFFLDIYRSHCQSVCARL